MAYAETFFDDEVTAHVHCNIPSKECPLYTQMDNALEEDDRDQSLQNEDYTH